MKLGNHLKRCRFDNDDMSQEALAQAVGVTRQTIFSIEKGRFVPSALLALKIAKFFKKPVEKIFFIIETEKSEPINQP
ncbi:helix-turn-helix transcriptional regulator [candidate division KSB1 bacterium]|nr:helix-turn-helix transcriptional regulator [candidate division KSB1 bacterium]